MISSLLPRLRRDQFSLGGFAACATPGTPPCCSSGPPPFNCGGCNIPETNLTCSWTGISPGSTTLIYNGAHAWTSGCIAFPAGYYFQFSLICSGFVPVFGYTWFSGLTNCNNGISSGGCQSGGCTNFTFPQTSLTCGSGFLATYSPGGGCCTGEGQVPQNITVSV